MWIRQIEICRASPRVDRRPCMRIRAQLQVEALMLIGIHTKANTRSMTAMMHMRTRGLAFARRIRSTSIEVYVHKLKLTAPRYSTPGA